MKSTLLIIILLISALVPSLGQAGDELAFSVDAEGETGFYIWSAATGKTRHLAEGYKVSGLCFSPDGKRIAFMAAHPAKDFLHLELYVLDLTSSTIKQVTTGFWSADADITWRPRTEQVAINRTMYYKDPDAYVPGDAGLWLINTRSGQTTQIIASSDSELPLNRAPVFSAAGSMLASRRCGRYAAVLDVRNPGKWYRLDQPEDMNPYWLRDWCWQGDNLLIGATAASGLPFQKGEKGRGGIWRWRVREKPAFTSPRLNWYEHVSQKQTRAELVFRKGETVYSLALSPDGRKLAYLMDSGLWLYDFEKNTQRQLASANDIFEIKKLRESDSGMVCSLADVDWSSSGRYLSLVVWDHGHVLRVIDVSTGRVIGPLAQGSRVFSAWRPGH